MPGPAGHSDLIYTRVMDISKGLIADKHEMDIGPTALTACNNALWREGYIIPRPGLAAHEFDPGTGRAIIYLNQISRSAAGNPFFVLLEADGLDTWLWYSTGGTWTNVYNNANSTTSEHLAYGVNFKGEHLMVFGDWDLVWFDGVSVGTVVSRQPTVALQCPTKPRLVTCNDSRVFVANTYDSGAGLRVPYRLHWSDTLNADVWNGGLDAGSSGSVDLAGESDPITALWAEGDVVMVMKRRCIYLGNYVGPPRFYDFRRAFSGPGCIAQATLRSWRDGILLWLGDDGVYLGKVGQQPQLVSAPIGPRLRQVMRTPLLRQSKAVMDRDRNFYHLILPFADSPHDTRKVFTLNLNNMSWWEGIFDESIGSITAAVDFFSSWDSATDFWATSKWLGSDSGSLYYFDWAYYSDAGADIPVSFTTGWLSAHTGMGGGSQANQAVIAQTVRYLSPSVTGVALTLVLIALDGFARSVEGITGTQTAQSGYLQVTGRISGEYFKLTVGNTVAGGWPPIAGYEVGWMPQGDKRRLR